ncbi:EamA family transporter, partial [Patescibacteria group bacterium]
FLGWGVGDIFAVVATRKIGGYSSALWDLVLRLIIFSVYIPFALNELKFLSPNLFLLIVLLGFSWLIGVISFYKALGIGNTSLVGTIAASFSAVVVIFSIVFLKENVTNLQAFSIIIIFLGLLLSTLKLKEIKTAKFNLGKDVFFAFIAMFAWGVYFTFIKIPVRQIGWFWPTYLSSITFLLILLFAKVKNIKINKPNLNNALFPLFLAVLLAGLANFSFNFGVGQGLTAIVAPIAGSYPVLFVILTRFIFKEPLSRQQVGGIITALLGIVLLSLV